MVYNPVGDTPADTSLSNIFSGVVVYFHHVSAEEVKKFSRYIIAYPFSEEFIFTL